MRCPLMWLLLPACLSTAVACADEAAIREKLRSRVQVKFDETPLVDVLKNLGEQAGVKFWIADEEIKGDGGTTEGMTVTLDWGEMQLDSALYFILERMHDLAAVPDEDDVIVTTVTKRLERHTTKVYDTRTIVDGMQHQWQVGAIEPARIRERLLSLPMTGAGTRQFDKRINGWGGQGFFQFGGMGATNYDTAQQLAGQLLTIGETLDPTWLNPKSITRSQLGNHIRRILIDTSEYCIDNCEGVNDADLQLAGDALVIRTSSSIHQEFAGSLQAMDRMFTEDQAPLFQWALRTGYPHKDDEKLRKSLQQIGTFKFENLRLDEALENLAKQAGIRLWIDRKSIQSDGGAVDLEVSFAAVEMPYEKILSRLLEQYGLQFEFQEGVMIVNTPTHFYDNLYLAVYDTSAIPEIRTTWQSAREINRLLFLNSGAWGHGRREPTAIMVTPSVMIVKQTQQVHREIADLLQQLRKESRKEPKKEALPPSGVYRPDLRPEFLTRVYPVFDPEAVEPSVTILKKLLANDQVKLMEVVKDSIVIQCTDEGHIRAEAYFEAIESAHRRRQDRIKPAPMPTPTPAQTP